MESPPPPSTPSPSPNPGRPRDLSSGPESESIRPPAGQCRPAETAASRRSPPRAARGGRGPRGGGPRGLPARNSPAAPLGACLQPSCLGPAVVTRGTRPALSGALALWRMEVDGALRPRCAGVTAARRL